VDQHVLAWLERVLHRHLLDLVGLSDEVLDDEEDDEGQDKCLDDLEETPKRAWAHKSGSIGAVLSSCPVTPSRRGRGPDAPTLDRDAPGRAGRGRPGTRPVQRHAGRPTTADGVADLAQRHRRWGRAIR